MHRGLGWSDTDLPQIRETFPLVRLQACWLLVTDEWAHTASLFAVSRH